MIKLSHEYILYTRLRDDCYCRAHYDFVGFASRCCPRKMLLSMASATCDSCYLCRPEPTQDRTRRCSVGQKHDDIAECSFGNLDLSSVYCFWQRHLHLVQFPFILASSHAAERSSYYDSGIYQYVHQCVSCSTGSLVSAIKAVLPWQARRREIHHMQQSIYPQHKHFILRHIADAADYSVIRNRSRVVF